MVRFLSAHFPVRTVFLGFSEVCLIALAFIGATFARVGTTNAGWILSQDGGYAKIVIVLLIFVMCMYYFDLYDSAVLSNLGEMLSRWIQVLGTVCILLALLYYLFPPLGLGRGIFVIGFCFGAVAPLLSRRLFLFVNRLPQFVERAVILGDGSVAESLIMELQGHPELGIRVVGHLKSSTSANDVQNVNCREKRITELMNSVRSYKPNRVVVAFGEKRGNLPVEALLQLKDGGLKIEEGVDLYEAITGKVYIGTLRLSDLLFSHTGSAVMMSKRALSIILSVIGLVLFFPLMLVITIAIRLDSAGPLIFRQKRVGKDGKLFTLYKFRTMVDRADEGDNHRPAEIADWRITRVGRLLRRAHLDELPQLINILQGDMTFVGPRPFVPNQERDYVQQIPYYSRRWAVRPGATGWAQVNRGYNSTIDDNRDKLAYDLFYIRNCSVGLDLLILFKTLKILILGRGGR
jgi:exopolysaccharide biosynthesis polyprenyl glycosylphosphotransferase